MAAAAALPCSGVTHAAAGLRQLGNWRKPGASKHHAGLPRKAVAMQTGGQHGSRDTTTQWHCGMRGELSITHSVHPGAWEKRQTAEGTRKGCWLPKASQPLEPASPEHRQTPLQAPLRLLADPAPSSGEELGDCEVAASSQGPRTHLRAVTAGIHCLETDLLCTDTLQHLRGCATQREAVIQQTAPTREQRA